MHQQVHYRGQRRGTRRSSARLAALTWPVLWLVVAAVVVLPYMHAYRHLSPFDELVHVDYVVKAQRLELVNGGEKVGQVAMDEQACRGHDLSDLPLPPCGTDPYDPNTFPQLGYNTAYPDPPLYYWVTAGGAAVVEAVPGVHDAVTAMRSIGVLWLGAGLALTFLLARRLGAETLPAAGATLVLAGAPAVAHASATVTSDAPALLTGALLCLVALGVVEGRVRWWWLLPAAFAAGFVKTTSLAVIGLVVVYLVLQLRPERPPDEVGPHRRVGRRTVALALAAVAGGGLVSILLWTVVSTVTAGPGADAIPMRDAFHVDSLSWTANVAPNIFQLVSPLQVGYLPPAISDLNLVVLMATVNLVLLAAVGGLAWLGPRTAESTKMAVATATAMLFGGPGFVLLLYVGSHTSIFIPPRYGLTLVPAAMAVLAVAASRRRAGGPLLLGLGAVALVALLVQTA